MVTGCCEDSSEAPAAVFVLFIADEGAGLDTSQEAPDSGFGIEADGSDNWLSKSDCDSAGLVDDDDNDDDSLGRTGNDEGAE